MNKVVDRIMEFYEHLGLNVSSFASSIGVNQVTMNNYKLGKRRPSLDLVEKVVQTYPQLSAEWLMRGVGDMFCHGDSNTEIQQTNVEGDNNAVVNSGDAVLQKENEMLKKQLADKDKEIEFLRQLINNK